MTEDRDIRHVGPEEVEAFVRATAFQFSEEISDERVASYARTTELDRTFACVEDGRIVGTAETISFTMGLPGAKPAPCAGLTSVGVHPLRRRRGILTAMLRRQTDQAHERGEPFGALYASETGIYRRYGYGVAAPSCNLTIPTRAHGLADPPSTDGIELVDAEAAVERLPAVYDRVQAGRPGMMSRSAAEWRELLTLDPADERDGFSARAHAVLGDRGYVLLRSKPDWTDGVADGTVRVVELLGTDAEAEAVLWQLCLSMDLMTSVTANGRPPDDPVLAAVEDRARVRVRPGAPLWLRLLSLRDAVAARGYSADGGAVLTVRDGFCAWNDGTWRFDLGPDGGSAERTSEEPDLVLDVADLAAAFLGGVRLSTLVRARRVEERRRGAAWALDRLLAADPLPWTPQIF
jgi:predicted acetyltransferase